MKRLIAAAVLVTWASATSASSWVHLRNASDGSKWSYDESTVQRSGAIVSVWLQGDLTEVKTDRAAELKVLMKYNCTDRTKFQRSVVAYARNGSVLDSNDRYEAPVLYSPVIPDSIDDAAVGLFCR